MEIKEYIISYLKTHGKLPLGDIDFDNFNYLKTGALDSLSTLKFLLTLEREFGITIEDDHLSDPSITTVSGLENFIKESIKANEY